MIIKKQCTKKKWRLSFWRKLKTQANSPTYGVRPGQDTLSLFYKDTLYKDIAFKLKINKDGKASKSKSLRHHNSSIIYIDD